MFVGHSGLGQKPDADTGSPLGLSSIETLNLAAIFSTYSRPSFVGSPLSNIEIADCLQPTSAASSLCPTFALRRASLSLKQISGFNFVTGEYYGLYFYQLQGKIINIFMNFVDNCVYIFPCCVDILFISLYLKFSIRRIF